MAVDSLPLVCDGADGPQHGSRILTALQCALTAVPQPQLDAESHGDVRRMQQVRMCLQPPALDFCCMPASLVVLCDAMSVSICLATAECKGLKPGQHYATHAADGSQHAA